MSFSRRDFLKITALSGAAVGLSAAGLRRWLQTGVLHKISETHYLMGTVVNFVILAENREQASVAIQTTTAEMRRLIQVYDYRQVESPLGQLNATGTLRQPPRELVATLRQALHFGTLSNGAFDITVKPLLDALRENLPATQALTGLVDYRQIKVSEAEIAFLRPGMALTLDGIAKGSIVDRGVAILQGLGFENVLVEAGGDLLAKGTNDTQGWKVGIAHPRATGEFAATISIQNQAVATSGDYMNYFRPDYSAYHIIDPRTGTSPIELASASVIAPSVTEADALSTTLMVLGVQAGLELIESQPQTAALLITKDLQIHRSSRFPVG